MSSQTKTIILLHGALGSGNAMQPLRELLDPHFNVIHPDLPGHGRRSSEEEPITIQSLAYFLERLIRTERLAHPVVFGYSMGGYIALVHALQYPGTISQVITLATKFRWDPQEAVKESRMLSAAMIETRAPALATLLRSRHGEENWKAVISRTADLMHALGAAPLLTTERVHHIMIPVTVGLGSEDRMVTPEESLEIADHLLSGRFQILSDIPHPLEKIPPHVITEFVMECIGRGYTP
jgi:pimeloyl-ACP methyl ester carboxylesterase